MHVLLLLKSVVSKSIVTKDAAASSIRMICLEMSRGMASGKLSKSVMSGSWHIPRFLKSIYF